MQPDRVISWIDLGNVIALHIGDELVEDQPWYEALCHRLKGEPRRIGPVGGQR